MKKVKKSWIALLLGALLLATLVGVVWARPKASPGYKLTIPAAHFHPKQDGYDWTNHGVYITMESGSGAFTSALPIALPGRFTVDKITLFAYDYNGTEDIRATLRRMNPYTGTSEAMVTVKTSGQSSVDPQRISSTNINPDTIYGAHGAYIWLYIDDSTNLDAYAIQVEYH